jgi:peptide/nickel transport system substrate-binding protein
MKGVPEDATRLAMLKKGEADIAIAFLDGAVAEEVKRAPHLTLVDTRHASMQWLEFADQWDPKSPWHDKRVRLAANYALDRQAISDAACLGYCHPTGVIVPRVMEFALPVEPVPYDPAKAKQLLAEAGYPNGFDAGELVPIPPAFTAGEAVVNYLNAVGIRVKMIVMERAPFYTAWRDKKLRNLFFDFRALHGIGPRVADHKQNLENLRRNHYAPNGMCETNVLRSQGAKPCAPSQATFPSMRCRPERPS